MHLKDVISFGNTVDFFFLAAYSFILCPSVYLSSSLTNSHLRFSLLHFALLLISLLHVAWLSCIFF